MSSAVVHRLRSRSRAAGVLPYLVVVLCALVLLPPLAWVLVTSFKRGADTVTYPPQWTPSPFSFEGYIGVFRTSGRFFLNSFLYAIASIAVALLVCIPAAYVATRYRSRRLEAVMTTILVLCMVPAMAVLVSLYALYAKSPLFNSYPLLIIVYTGMICGQTILFLRSFIENVPLEIEEAAAVDGCTRRQILWRIVIPLIRPGIAAIAIYIFVFVWNDYLIGTVLTTTEAMRPVQNGLVRYLETNYGTSWGLFSAYVILAFLPVLAIFVGFQRWFIEGLTAGGVKG